MADSNDTGRMDPNEDGWAATEPKDGFADRVMSGLRAQGAFAPEPEQRGAPPAPIRAVVVSFVAGAAVAAAVALLIVRLGSGSQSTARGGAEVAAAEVARVAVELSGDSATLTVRSGQVLVETAGGEPRLVKSGGELHVPPAEAVPDAPDRSGTPSAPGPGADRAVNAGSCYCPDDARPLDADQDVLDQWVAVCRVHADVPPLAGPTPEDLAQLAAIADTLELTGTERDAFRDASLAFAARAVADLRRIYTDATGDTSDVDEIEPEMLITLIDRTAGPGEPPRVRQRLARERAGLDEAPTDMSTVSPYEELYRGIIALADGFERELAERIGAERARQLRAMHGGWPGPAFDWIGCP